MDDALKNYMPGKVLAFKGEGLDAVIEATVLVEITDTAADEIELAFEAPNPQRRYYVRLPQHALLKALMDARESEA